MRLMTIKNAETGIHKFLKAEHFTVGTSFHLMQKFDDILKVLDLIEVQRQRIFKNHADEGRLQIDEGTPAYQTFWEEFTKFLNDPKNDVDIEFSLEVPIEGTGDMKLTVLEVMALQELGIKWKHAAWPGDNRDDHSKSNNGKAFPPQVSQLLEELKPK